MKRSTLKRTTPLKSYSRLKGSRSGRVVTCAREGCTTTFYVQPASLGRRKCCSRACAAAVKQLVLPAARKGDKNPNFKHGLRTGQNDRGMARTFSLALKGETCCRNCGSTENLQLHHAIPRSIGTKESRASLLNGLPLCATCHSRWHRGGKGISRRVFTVEEWAYISSVQLTGRETADWLDRRYPDVALARPGDLA